VKTNNYKKKIHLVEFFKIKFCNLNDSDFRILMKKTGLFVFPSGPGLATIDKDKKYHKALQNSDYVFFDSGYFVLLLKLLKDIKVKKFSGYLFIKFLIKHFKKSKDVKLLSVDPSLELSKNNYDFFLKLGLKNQKIFNYIAPKYNDKNISDKKLLKIVKNIKPDYILINIGGGVQEILGYYLKDKIKIKSKIICTGAAISFFTGDQAPLNKFFDDFSMGWLIRIFYNPKIFFLRYFKAIRLYKLVNNNKVYIRN